MAIISWPECQERELFLDMSIVFINIWDISSTVYATKGHLILDVPSFSSYHNACNSQSIGKLLLTWAADFKKGKKKKITVLSIKRNFTRFSFQKKKIICKKIEI